MKLIAVLLFLPLAACAKEKERIFTASTPADPVIRAFLGISLTDSIDFIRWQLLLTDENNYRIQCSYGIGKPNTNGFIKGGKTVELRGELKIEKNYYQLKNKNSTLNIIELNNDLLHLLNPDKKLLVGNGGWSYTLNNIDPVMSDEISLPPRTSTVKDSIVFDGRTPCNIPGVVPEATACYKLKWRIILYEEHHYKILGTAWRKENGQTGNWKTITAKNGHTIYQLSDTNGNILLHLLKADENILLFTDANGKLLTGNENFSYTLNRKNN